MKIVICFALLCTALFWPGAVFSTGIPLQRVVLFNSGVGYFERAGVITNSVQTELSFAAEKINDVIKSLVLIDEDGGTIGAVTYESRDPVERTLKTFQVDLSDNPGRPALFYRLRGVQVRVKTSGQDLTGRILGVEENEVSRDEAEFTEYTLNLSCEDGIRSILLDQVQKVEVVDKDLQSDLDRALETLANSMDRGAKKLVISFKGKGARDVAIGYMIETPVWKTSYRLVLVEDKPFIQGWGHVENTTDENWQDVRLSLVSGRPISFIQNLYDPIYVKRPVVEMETYGSVAPPQYDADMVAGEKEGASYSMMPMMAMAEAPSPAPVMPPGMRRSKVNAMAAGGGGVAAAAEQKESGELFEYEIHDPVTIPPQAAAMLPIINAPIQGTALSIFNPAVHARYPLNGIEIENSSKLFLMQGPVTVFEGGIYAGDGRLGDTPPAQKALISYALDLASEVQAESDSEPEQTISAKVVNGVMILQRKYVSLTRYTIKSKRSKKRWLILEQPYRRDWDLVEPKEAWERTADLYRFRIELDAGKTTQFLVKEQRMGDQSVYLSNLDMAAIEFYVSQKVVSAGIREALKKLTALKLDLAKIQESKQQMEQQLRRITTEQSRIRDNMKTLDKTSELYSKLERKLAAQEDEIDQLTGNLGKASEEELRLRQGIGDFIAKLNVE